MTTTLSFTPGANKRKRIVAIAYAAETVATDDVAPMVQLYYSGITYPIMSAYGTVYGHPADYHLVSDTLKTLPDGQRGLSGAYIGSWYLYGDADDRCQNAAGTLADVSATPTARAGNAPDVNAVTITAATKANPVQLTYTGTAAFANGDLVTGNSFVGMTQLNNVDTPAVVSNLDTGAKTFNLVGVDSTGFTTYTSGGKIGRQSGYPGVWCTNFKARIKVWAAQAAATIAAEGGSVDGIWFDTEFRLDQFQINNAYRTALTVDPRWVTDSLPRLNQIINQATNGATTVFDTAAWLGGNADHAMAWFAYQNEMQNAGHNAVIEGFKTIFPNCSGSNYETHGQSAAVVTPTVGIFNQGITDQNGIAFYNTSVTGDFGTNICYGWISELGLNQFSHRSRSHWNGWINQPTNPYHTLAWEWNKTLAAVRSGVKSKPFVAYPGFDDSDFQHGGIGPAAITDTSPYWLANIAGQAVMSSDPPFIATDWSPPGLLFFNSAVNIQYSVVSVDLATNEFVLNGGSTIKLRPGVLQSLIISGSTSNNGTYTVTRVRNPSSVLKVQVAETIPSASGTLGGVSIGVNGDPGDTALVQGVLTEVNALFGTSGPRGITPRGVFVGEVDATDTEIVPTGNPMMWCEGRCGDAKVYCIAIGRVSLDKSTWLAEDITAWVNGVNVGVIGTISSSRVHLLYKHPNRTDLVTFTRSQAVITNLVANDDIANLLSSGLWTPSIGGSGSITQPSTHLAPDGSNSFRLLRSEASIVVPVTAWSIYTASAYIHTATDNVRIEARRGSNGIVIDTAQTRMGGINAITYPSAWGQPYFSFIAPDGETEIEFVVGLNNSSYDGYYCHPQVVQGILPGPIA